MPTCLVDVNVWLAILRPEHPHHVPARAWYRVLPPNHAGLCRFVQLSVIRLLGNKTVMGHAAKSAAAAWEVVLELMEDERVELVHEPPGLDSILPTLLRYRTPTPSLINDAYLAAFAIASGRRLATLDRGFEQFPGLELEILGL